MQHAFCIGSRQNGRSGPVERCTGIASGCIRVQLLAGKPEKVFKKIIQFLKIEQTA